MVWILDRYMGHSISIPYTPSGRFTVSILQRECNFQMDWHIEQGLILSHFIWKSHTFCATFWLNLSQFTLSLKADIHGKKKKTYFQILVRSWHACLGLLHCSIGYCVELFVLDNNLCQNYSHFIKKMFHPYFLNKWTIKRKVTRRCKQFKFLKIWECPLYGICEYTFNYNK